MPEIYVESVDGKKQRFPITKSRLSIGRSRENDIFLADQWLSRHHAEIQQKPEGYFLVDLGSKNGTLLNGTKITAGQKLQLGDVITLGEHRLTFEEPVEGDADDEQEPMGTQVFSARELSDVSTKPVVDLEGLAKQNRVLGVLTQATSALLAHRPLPELFELILDLLLDAVPAERAAILVLEGSPPEPVVKASRSRRKDSPPLTKVSRSIARRVLTDRVSLLIPSIMEDASFRSQDSILSTGIRSAVCAPLWYTGGSTEEQDAVIGLVYLDTLMHAHSFTEEDLRTLTALGNVAAAKIENVRLLEESMEKRRLEEDMKMAAEIQNGLLPSSAPTLPGYGLAGSNRACRGVGGDYFDFMIDEGHLLFALGDVSGKGTAAALIMTVLRASVRGHWDEIPPSAAMARINRTVCQNVPEGKYVTFFMGRLDPASGRVTYVNAGHNPPILVRANGETEMLEEGGMVLGIFESVPYADGSVDLATGDTLLIFSDGVTETFSRTGAEFGEQGLIDLARRERLLSAEAMQDAILHELEGFAGGGKATDDRTLIVLRRD